jgi:hypothetical protein
MNQNSQQHIQGFFFSVLGWELDATLASSKSDNFLDLLVSERGWKWDRGEGKAVNFLLSSESWSNRAHTHEGA